MANENAAKNSNEDFKPYHDMLPSIAGAHQNISELTSDHVPILATIPWPENKKMESFDILSWNMLGENKSSGFMKPGTMGGTHEETPAQTIARRDKNADILVEFLINHNSQFITLQECDKELAGLIQRKLEEKAASINKGNKNFNYQSIKINNQIVDKGGVVTFYNANAFKPDIKSTAKIGDLYSDQYQGLVTEFTHNDSGKKVKLANVQAPYSAVSTVHEKNIDTFLKDKKEGTKAVMVGDFNCHIAPLPTRTKDPKNIVTSATPAFFRNHTRQGACAIDGCFHSDNSEKGVTRSRQTKIQHLNPKTKTVYKEGDLPAVDLKSVPPQQKEEINTYRMAICVDESYENIKIIGDSTIFQYEEFFRELYSNEDTKINVRYATDLNNEPGIAVILPKARFDYLKSNDNINLFQFVFDQMNGVTNLDSPIVFVPQENINVFLHLTAMLPLKLNLEKLKPTDPQAPFLANDIGQKLNALYQQLDQLLKNDPLQVVRENSPYPILCEHFAKLSAQLIGRAAPLTVEEIEASAKQLDEKLFGKEPIPTALKMAIGALIGALVGFALGLVAGAAVTAWGGGFGAIPGAFIGAFEGFTAGTAIFTGAAGVGTIAGGMIGAIHGRFFKNVHEEEKVNKTAAIDVEVMAACKNVLTL